MSYGPERRKGGIRAAPYENKPDTGVFRRAFNFILRRSGEDGEKENGAEVAGPNAFPVPLEEAGFEPNAMHRPFNGDPAVEREVTHLITKLKVSAVVETGTFRGATTEYFAKMPSVHEVYTIESDKAQFEFAKKRLAPYKRICCVQGDSPQVLKISILQHVKERGPVCFYLDANGNGPWPLVDELKAIAEVLADQAILVIDDFQVPGKNFEFGTFGGVANKLSNIEKILDDMYPGGYEAYYNSICLSSQPVGKLFVVPKVLLDKEKVATSSLVKEEQVDGETVKFARGMDIFM